MKSMKSGPAGGLISNTLWPISKQILVKARGYIFYRESLILLKKPINRLSDVDNRHSLVIKTNDGNPEIVEILKSAYPKKAKIFDWRLRNDALLIATFLPEGSLVGSCWFSFKDFFEPANRFTVSLGRNQVYQFDGIVQSGFRRSKIGKTAICLFWSELFDRGYSEILALVNMKNIEALKWHKYMRFIELQQRVDSYFLLGKPFSIWRAYFDAFL